MRSGTNADAIMVNPTLCTVWHGNDGGDENDLVAICWEIVMLANLLIFTPSKVSFAAEYSCQSLWLNYDRKITRVRYDVESMD